MKRIFLILLTILMVDYAQASAGNGKIEYGLFISPYTNAYLLAKSQGPLELEGKLNFSMGANIKIPIKSTHFISFESGYTQRNIIQKIDYSRYRPINENDPLLITRVLESTMVQGYLDLVVQYLFEFYSSEDGNFYLSSGFVNSIQLFQNIKDSKDANEYGFYNKNYFAGLEFSVGYQRLSEKLNFAVEQEMRIYPFNIHENKSYGNPVDLGLKLILYL